MNLLSHETRHQIIQVLLGHQAHLPSTAEFNYFLPDTTATDIVAQLDRLREAAILDEYTFESEHGTDFLTRSMGRLNTESKFSVNSTISAVYR